MKKSLRLMLFAIAFIVLTAMTGVVSVNIVKDQAMQKNQEKVALVQHRIDETVELLEDLTEDERIRATNISFEEKAQILTDINQDKGYMMIRILDRKMNVYKEGVGLASNLSSRDYLQELYKSGETQVTDAFVAGADGKTVNYTVAVAIKEGETVVGALFASIYGAELEEYLKDAACESVLIGSEFQYVAGMEQEEFGLSVARLLESELKTSVPVENVLLDFKNRSNGQFWGFGKGRLQCFVYAPIENTNWVIMTEVPLFQSVKHIMVLYGCSLLILIAAMVYVFRKKKSE